MEIAKFRGLVNTVAPERMKPGQLSAALDVDIDDSGAIRTRRGLTQVSATASHSMWANKTLCLVMQGSTLRRMAEDGTTTALATLSSSAFVSYAEYNGVVYLSNGVDAARVVGGAYLPWGLANPTHQPAAATTGIGSLPAATYMYAATFIRDDGLESGTPVPALVTLDAPGGIVFTGLPAPAQSSVVAVAIYLSGPNGSELYRAAVVPSSQDAVAVTHAHLDAMSRGMPLDPSPRSPAPAGTLVESHGGRMYIADGPVAWYSDQFAPEVFRRENQYLLFDGPITLMASVGTGMYVGTDTKAWFLRGTDALALASDDSLVGHGAIPGTARKFDSEQLVNDDEDSPTVTEPAVLWTSQRGIMLGNASGQVRNLTEAHYGIPGAQRGAGLVREARGYVTYVAALQGTESAANSY